jgi:histone-lysine N-methyltransferase ASH1L
MILDGTKGSIARFINHSCKPNCKMVKWYVGGKPRMALFAGENPIMTGDELTYDYNFDPFSAKNVQECRCGSDNCRGILGPKPKEIKPVKETLKDAVKAGIKAGKRKLKELFRGNETDDDVAVAPSPKKRKTKEAKATKGTAALKNKKLAKGTKAVKRTVTSHLKARRAVPGKRGGVIVKKTIKKKSMKTYGKGKAKLASISSTVMVVEHKPASKASVKSGLEKKKVRKNAAKSIRGVRKGSRGPSDSTIEVISSFGDEVEDEDDNEEYEDEDSD